MQVIKDFLRLHLGGRAAASWRWWSGAARRRSRITGRALSCGAHRLAGGLRAGRRPAHRGGGRSRHPIPAHPEQDYRSTLGLLRLSNRFGTPASSRQRAIAIRAAGYRTVKTILRRRMEAAPLPDHAEAAARTAEFGAETCTAAATTTELVPQVGNAPQGERGRSCRIRGRLICCHT